MGAGEVFLLLQACNEGDNGIVGKKRGGDKLSVRKVGLWWCLCVEWQSYRDSIFECRRTFFTKIRGKKPKAKKKQREKTSPRETGRRKQNATFRMSNVKAAPAIKREQKRVALFLHSTCASR